MRIDLALKYLCIVKSRSLAKALCDQGRVLVRGEPARSSLQLRAGDRVTVHFAGHSVTIMVDVVPEKQLSKSNALTYYRSVEPRERERRADVADPLDEL